MGSGLVGGTCLTHEEKVLEVAKHVVSVFTHHADGEPLDNYVTLQGLARMMLCYVVPQLGGGSSYSPVGAGQYRGAIRLDVSQCGDDVVRDFAHELAHHVLNIYTVQLRFDAPPDVILFEEEVCRSVSGIVKALPAGLLWNGKLAPPRGDGTIRCFARLDVRVPSQSIPAEEWEELESS